MKTAKDERKAIDNKKCFASAEAYHSDKEFYQEVLEEWDQMVKNDSYEDLYGSKKVEEIK